MADISITQAAAAYKNNAKMLQGLAGEAGEAGADAPKKSAFSQLISQAVGDAIDVNYKSEAVRLGALAGKAELHELVTAVTAAEVSLQTVVAIRDRVISAYQDILRMPI